MPAAQQLEPLLLALPTGAASALAVVLFEGAYQRFCELASQADSAAAVGVGLGLLGAVVLLPPLLALVLAGSLAQCSIRSQRQALAGAGGARWLVASATAIAFAGSLALPLRVLAPL